MALFRAGIAVGQISGRVAGNIFSHNRGGPYIRNGTIPIASTTGPALNAKGILANKSQEWQGLTDTQRAAWREWANTHQLFNRIGRLITLSGQQAYVQINSRLAHAGVASISDPPIDTPPTGPGALTGSYDIGAGTFEIAWANTPLGANEALYTRVAVVSSSGINFVRNLLKLIDISSAAATSPLDLQTEIEARFGTLQVGQKLVYLVSVLDVTTGLISQPREDSGIIVST